MIRSYDTLKRTSFLSLFSASLFFLISLFAACSSDSEEEILESNNNGESTDCTETISLADDVQPIIASNCAVSGCHAPGGTSPDFTQKQNIISRASSIKIRTGNGSMPPAQSGLSLSSTEISQIACWVDNGADDN